MKIIKYHLKNADEEEKETRGPECAMPWSEENMAVARAEAYGEISVEDDGKPSLEQTDAQGLQDDMDAMMIDHELRLTMLELGI